MLDAHYLEPKHLLAFDATADRSWRWRRGGRCGRGLSLVAAFLFFFIFLIVFLNRLLLLFLFFRFLLFLLGLLRLGSLGFLHIGVFRRALHLILTGLIEAKELGHCLEELAVLGQLLCEVCVSFRVVLGAALFVLVVLDIEASLLGLLDVLAEVKVLIVYLVIFLELRLFGLFWLILSEIFDLVVRISVGDLVEVLINLSIERISNGILRVFIVMVMMQLEEFGLDGLGRVVELHTVHPDVDGVPRHVHQGVAIQ